MKVTILGAGRMGSFIAKRIPEGIEILIVDTNENVARALAKGLAARWSTRMDAVEGSRFVFVLLPAQVVREAVQEMLPYLDGGSVIVNMATTVSKEDLGLGWRNPNIPENSNLPKMVSVKIIGHYREMELGERATIVIEQSADEQAKQQLCQLLSEAGDIVSGPTDLVAVINTIASEEGIRAAVAIDRKLREQGVPEEWIQAAIRLPAAGTMKAYALNDLGPFALEVIRKMRSDFED